MQQSNDLIPQEFTTTVTQRGQVTLPAKVRRLLGVSPKDKVVFRVESGSIQVQKPAFTLESAFGSVKPLQRPENFKKIIREAKEEHAEKLMQKMRQGRA